MQMMNRHALLAASVVLLLAASVAAHAEADVAGVTAAVNPQASAFDGSGKGRLISLGDPVIRNHRIETNGEGLVQILLADGTSFTVGPNSSVVIDSFVYDPAKNTASLAATMTKGALRFIGGKASKAGGGVTINTPIGTAGIRGAVVDINLDGRTADGQPIPPHLSLIYGKEVQLNGAGGPQRLFKPGFSIFADGGTPRVQRTPQQWVSSLQQVLASRAGQQGGVTRPPTDQTVRESTVSQSNSGQLPENNAIPVPQPRPIISTPVEEVAGESQRDVGERPQVPVTTDPEPEPDPDPEEPDGWDGSATVVSQAADEDGNVLLYSRNVQMTLADGTWSGSDSVNGSFTLDAVSTTSSLTVQNGEGESGELGALRGKVYTGTGEFLAYLLTADGGTPFYVVGGETADVGESFTSGKILHYELQTDPVTGSVTIGAVDPTLRDMLAAGSVVNSDLLVAGISGDTSEGKALQTSLSINGARSNQTSAINVTVGTFGQLSAGGVGLEGRSSGSYLTGTAGDAENSQAVVENIGGKSGEDELFGADGEYMVIVGSDEYVDAGADIRLDREGVNVVSRNDAATTNATRSWAGQTVEGFASGVVTNNSNQTKISDGTASFTFGSDGSFESSIYTESLESDDYFVEIRPQSSQTAYLTDKLIAATGEMDGSYIVSSDVVPAQIFANNTSATICNSCEFMTWGWWGKSKGMESTSSVHLGNWIIGDQPENGALPTTGTATYAGNAVGTVLNSGSQYIATGAMSSTMNFGTRTGTIAISDYDSRNLNANLTFGANAATFSGGSVSGIDTSVTGAFASNGVDPVKGIMGSFNATDGAWSTTGIFAGSKSAP